MLYGVYLCHPTALVGMRREGVALDGMAPSHVTSDPG
jgi:hypothetical protein